MSKQRPFAVFDIDGTIIRWQLYHAVVDELVKTGQLDSGEFQTVRQARMNWKRRHHETSYRAYETILVELFNTAVTDISVEDLRKAYQAVIGSYKDQVYTYTRDLIDELKAKNYLLFAISASQDEIVKMLADYYEFDDAGGSVYEVKNGRFTGQSEILRSERKPEFLKELVKKHSATWQGSIALGDSEGDIPMLSAVEQPIAFNPTKDLFEHAKKQGWPVVVERKNMVYKLEPGDGSYLLA
ncbi:HAD-IB family hydrolase [Candidatus Saccharibacteria bacterium CG_4_10_14_0_2_um_filter_52_9]|nr:MAG: HAD-IB family hydrolase [Candidatus Saccharibacteria bacterium CG_4_10_14_0_2_um_filter_52_9]